MVSADDEKEQMSFDFFGADEQSDAGKTEEQVVFDSEEDALAALIEEPVSVPPVSPEAHVETPLPDTPEEVAIPVPGIPFPEPPADSSDNASPDPFGEERENEPEEIQDTPADKSASAVSEPQTTEETSEAEYIDEIGPKKHPYPPMNRIMIQRAALAWLAMQRPDTVSVHTAGFSAVAVWFAPPHDGVAGIGRTAAALGVTDITRLTVREKTVNGLRVRLESQLTRKTELESKLREREPWLNESLFAEDGEWDYSQTKNRSYHACLRRIQELRARLDSTSALSAISARKTVNVHYIVIPEGLDADCLIPSDWGIVKVSPEFRFTLEREAEVYETDPRAGLNLVCRMASETASSVLLSAGLAVTESALSVHPLPRLRKPYTAE